MNDAAGGPVERLLARIDSPWRMEPATPLEHPPDRYTPPDDAGGDPEVFRDRLRAVRKRLRPLQRQLYAQQRYAVLLVFQALDAAGKDGAIRQVLRGLDPNGVRVTSFKRPTPRQLAHDFLWRTTQALPAHGDIVAFNRSHYEEVLVVRVHPELLEAQFRGSVPLAEEIWPRRYRAIREHERHLACSNTVILKFWLNVSPERQAERFLRRLDDPERQWKFAEGDVHESRHRTAYDEAIRVAINETSRPWAPWFCIPADDRWYLRWQVADILLQALEALPLAYPAPDPMDAGERERYLAELRARAGVDVPSTG